MLKCAGRRSYRGQTLSYGEPRTSGRRLTSRSSRSRGILLKALGADGRDIVLMHRGDRTVSQCIKLDANSEDIHLETTEAPRRRLVPEVHVTRCKLLRDCGSVTWVGDNGTSFP